MNCKLYLRITVHTPEKVVYAKIRYEHAQEGKNEVGMIEARIAEGGDSFSMQGHGIDHKGDERPRLLRVPRPVGAPRDICPNGAEEDACGEKEYGGV